MLHIDESLFLGRGLHKAAYAHPEDAGKVVKIPFKADDAELAHELAYRKSRERRHLASQTLTAYYGTVETDLGMGYIFERVQDFDGSPCPSVKERLQELNAIGDEKAAQEAHQLAESVREAVFAERILTNDTGLLNFVLQRNSPQETVIRMIDNIGSPVLIPLVYYIDRMTLHHIRKYWRRVEKRLRRDYPALFC